MFSRILVPIDFSPPSDAALAHARAIAERFGATLHLLHVTEQVFLRAVAEDPGEREAALVRQLEARLPEAERRGVAVRAAVERSDAPADAIVDHARAEGIDLIVMGTHGRSGMAHLLTGSVAGRVVRAALCPVLTVRNAPAAPAAGPRHIVVAVDFSAASDAALDVARALAGRLGAALHLLHVVEEPPAHGAVASEVYLADSPVTRTERLEDAQAKLSHRITGPDRERLDVKTEVVFGASADMIVNYAADTGADLIVLGTHGRTGIAHLLLGSIAEKVVRTADCPVLTVRRRSDEAARTEPAGASTFPG